MLGPIRLATAALRLPRALGFELTPILPPAEACLRRIKEIRTRLGEVDTDSRQFVELSQIETGT